MPKPPEIKAAVKRGAAYLAKQQQPDGGFISLSSPSAELQPLAEAVVYRTNFVPAIMLAALAGARVTGTKTIRERLAAFLLGQKNPGWSFNYWSEAAPERKTLPYPDDLDDTFCALSSLFLHDSAIVNEEALAGAVKLLLAAETAVGGPYRTWLVPPDSKKAWLDVDLAVNSNVAYFLSLAGNGLPNISRLMDQAILSGRLESPYYPSAYPLAYFMARAYGDGEHKKALAGIVASLQATASTALDQALCLTASMKLKTRQPSQAALKKLLALQLEDGSWPAAAFCVDPVRAKQTHYNGAPALTTALAMEALELHLRGNAEAPAAKTKPSASLTDIKIQTAVLAAAKKNCQSLGQDLRQSTLQALKGLAVSSNGPEIITLPYKFNQSLAGPLKPVDGAFLETLGLANLYGWLAYTIYDDFLDGEGRAELLSVANVASRASLDGFSDALPSANEPFQSLVKTTFNTIDSANAWELAHCRLDFQDNKLLVDKRLPDYGNLSKLAERSLGHTLSPLAVLVASSVKIESRDFQQTQKALRHYLIARQLNDDAHDWETDLKNGHVTYVVGEILAAIAPKPGTYAVDSLLPKAKRQFWHDTLPDICRQMQHQVNLSRKALAEVKALKPINVITKLLDGIEDSVRETSSTQSQASNFLKYYGKGAR